MTLSKLELQQMLREMNVKFDAEETYEELKLRLQQEHHSLWLKSVSSARTTPDGARKTVVRKRRRKITPPELPAKEPQEPRPKTVPAARDTNAGKHRSQKLAPACRPRSIEKPEPGKPWKPVADGVEPFNRKKHVIESVLRRAGGCCERCGQEAGKGTNAGELIAYHIQPLDQGGEHSIKNVVAVCPACNDQLQQGASARDLKEMKRKTRSKLYDSLQIVRKTNKRIRRPGTGRRK